MPKKNRAHLPVHDKQPQSPAVPPKTPPTAPQPAEWIGSMKGTVKILGDIVSPANEESDWEVLRD